MSSDPIIGTPHFDPEVGTTVVKIELDDNSPEAVFAAMTAAGEALFAQMGVEIVKPPRCMANEVCKNAPSVKLTLNYEEVERYSQDENLAADPGPLTLVVELCTAHLDTDLKLVLLRLLEG